MYTHTVPVFDFRCSTITMREALENWLSCTTHQGVLLFPVFPSHTHTHTLSLSLSLPLSLSLTHTHTSRAATVVATSTGVLWALVSTNPLSSPPLCICIYSHTGNNVLCATVYSHNMYILQHLISNITFRIGQLSGESSVEQHLGR